MKKNQQSYGFVLIIGAIVGITTLVALVQIVKNRSEPDLNEMITATDIIEGKYLAKQYCTGCHRFPEPERLPESVWRAQTLPAMGPLLGIFKHRGREYPIDMNRYVPEETYPSAPVLTEDEWEKILKYYTLAAPDELTRPTAVSEIVTDSLFFRPRTADYKTDSPPASTVAKLDPGNQHIYVSDIDGTNLLIFNNKLELESTLYLSAAIADVRIVNNLYKPGARELILTYIGSLLPSDAPSGFIVKTEFNPDPEPGSRGGGAIETIMDRLVRPVRTETADLDADGNEDLLVHEFGHRTGSLFWLKGNGQGYDPEKRLLMDTPGCIRSHITDYNGNGHPDVISLCTQADQALYLFENQGEGEFVRKTLLRFPVTAGSTSFEMHDFNGDSHPDILYTSGDNADFSITFKPYHGVYIYLNDGHDNFTETWFYPVNGAYDAKAGDFDRDGYLDIAVISYFADYVNRPAEGFVLFRHNGEDTLSFTPYHHPAASSGRWITMDVADWTGNGYDDILLANFSLGPDVTEEQARMDEVFINGPLFLLLENRCPEAC